MSRSHKNKKLTLNEFVTRSCDVHDNKYDYILVDYINNRIH